MGDCNERRVFYDYRDFFWISICQYSDWTGDKILKTCQKSKLVKTCQYHHTVFLHRFVPTWSSKALDFFIVMMLDYLNNNSYILIFSSTTRAFLISEFSNKHKYCYKQVSIYWVMQKSRYKLISRTIEVLI